MTNTTKEAFRGGGPDDTRNAVKTKETNPRGDILRNGSTTQTKDALSKRRRTHEFTRDGGMNQSKCRQKNESLD
jgi:hypothetical protein